MFFLVAYDIDDDKRRKKVASILEGYGIRVNFSVFEVELNKTQLKELMRELKSVSKRRDNIRFYHICKNCVEKSFLLHSNGGVFCGFDGFV